MNARDRWQWTDQAACRDKDPAIFFPLNEANVAAKAQAREVCRGCPVRPTCSDTAFHGIDGPKVEGVWGGATGLDRTEVYRVIERIERRGRPRKSKAKHVETTTEE